MSFTVGVDLGQAHDYTAICVLQEREGETPHSNSYGLRHLERFRETSYPDVVKHLRRLAMDLPGSSMAIDATGVGRPVVDMIEAANLPADIYAITLTGGDTVQREGRSYRVPKRDVASAVAVLLQTNRLVIASNLALSDTLLRELQNFRARISPTGHDTYSAWRERDHDDLVLAVALAVWLAEKGQDAWLRLARDFQRRRREGLV